jgi:hypothetical protein
VIVTNYPNETNGLIDPKGYHDAVTHRIERTVYWTEPGLTVTRLRLLTEPGFPAWDVSYCHGILAGEPVEVSLPFTSLPKRGASRAIVEYAKRDGVHAKSLGILDCMSRLW